MQDRQRVEAAEYTFRALDCGIPAIQHIDNGPGYVCTALAGCWPDSKEAKEHELLERMAK